MSLGVRVRTLSASEGRSFSASIRTQRVRGRLECRPQVGNNVPGLHGAESRRKRVPIVDNLEDEAADQAAKHDLPESDVVEQVLLSQNAIKRLIEPTDIAATVAFLCTDEAWSFTGGAITMDAGWLAH